MAGITRPGDILDVPVGHRTGPKEQQVVVATPCCKVTYRIGVEEIAWYLKRGNEYWIQCGKVRRGRGRRRTPHGTPGCMWGFHITFQADSETGAITGSQWRA